MDKLRDEIVEAQKIRADLIKWKLILVAAIGSAGLGLKGNPNDDIKLLLCLIPFVCVYVDIAARHLNLRMHVIAEFMRRQTRAGETESCWNVYYEEYAKTMHEKGVFALETGVLRYSTIFLSILVITAAFYGPVSAKSLALFGLSGLFGIVVAVRLESIYEKKLKCITGLAYRSS